MLFLYELSQKEFVLVDAITDCLSKQPLKGAIKEDENAIEELVTTLQKMKVKASRDIFLKGRPKSL